MIPTTSSQNGQYVRANGLNMYYEEFGSGKSLVLIHGGMGIGKTLNLKSQLFLNCSELLNPILVDTERQITRVENLAIG